MNLSRVSRSEIIAIAGGILLAFSLFLSWYHATGQGETIDISMLDCHAAMLTYQAAYFLHAGQAPGRQGSGVRGPSLRQHAFDNLGQLP